MGRNVLFLVPAYAAVSDLVSAFMKRTKRTASMDVSWDRPCVSWLKDHLVFCVAPSQFAPNVSPYCLSTRKIPHFRYWVSGAAGRMG